MTWAKELLLVVFGLSFGMMVSGGLFSFITSLGVISDFADRTQTGTKILLYEDAITLGGTLGNLVLIYGIPLPGGTFLLGTLGLFSGIFVGCWAMALAEVLNLFPVFIRRAKVVKAIPYIIVSIALGKGVGAFVYYYLGW